jgi:hypothetical protein
MRAQSKGIFSRNNEASKSAYNEPKFTTFGVGRNAFKKVVASNNRNYGEPYDLSVPGPGEYAHKNNYEMGSLQAQTTIATTLHHNDTVDSELKKITQVKIRPTSVTKSNSRN